MSREKFSLILQESKEIAPLVRHFSFVRKDGETFDFIPGQFINLFFEHQDGVLQRSYSLANIPGNSNDVELALSYVSSGRASDYLFNMVRGDEILANGPFGRLTLREEQPMRYVLVATGTGVTPYRSMLMELAKRMHDTKAEVVLLQGGRSPEDLLYRDEFIDFAERHNNFTFYGCCSRTLSNPAQDYEREGYVQAQFDALNLDPERDMVFLCGNPNMIDDAYAKLTDMGFTAKNVRREKYVFSSK
jgi:ferredoxin-NADP reductase